MTIYYIKQDNTVWCCEEDSGKYYEQIDVSFVKCECSQIIEQETFEEHLQGHKGGGRVLKWRKAKQNEISAWYAAGDEFFDEGIEFEQQRIIGRIKAQICFDALADQEGRCSNHSGKCFELGLLVKELEGVKNA